MIPGTILPKKSANLIIAGVNKAGSTSLFHYLSVHPEICGSRDKETCYFLPVLYNAPVPPISEYEAQFSHCAQQRYRLEATPGYVTGGEKMAAVISNTLGEVKVIIILREPVERLVSFYKRKTATLQLPGDMSFRDFVNRCKSMNARDLALHENHLYSALNTGTYAAFIEPWLKTFRNTIKIVFFEDLKNDPANFMKDLALWLGIDGGIYNDFDFDVKNKSMDYKNQVLQHIAVSANRAGQRFWRSNPGIKKNLLSLYYKLNGKDFSKDAIDEGSLAFLHEYYLPHNKQLMQLLSRYGINEKRPSWLQPVNEMA